MKSTRKQNKKVHSVFNIGDSVKNVSGLFRILNIFDRMSSDRSPAKKIVTNSDDYNYYGSGGSEW